MISSQDQAIADVSEFLDKYKEEIEQRDNGCIVKVGAPPRVTFKNIPVYRLMLQTKEEYSLSPYDIARHTCDNPYCFNPDHIIIGTRADNNRDRCHDKYFRKATKSDIDTLFG